MAEVDFDSPAGWNAGGVSAASLLQQRGKDDISNISSQSLNLPIHPDQSQIQTQLQEKPTQLPEKMSTAEPSTLRQRAPAHDHHDHHDEHGHSHGILGGHHHHHDHGSPEEADRLIAALKGKGDRGSNITLLGLLSNILLCISKGFAGVLLNSASLVADAAHSLSDMVSDLVTLFCWKMSQKPPSQMHPMGYGKYETMGGLGVSVVLVGGAAGIGMHSWGLLLEALGPMLETAPVWIKALGAWSGSLANLGAHEHGHAHSAVADANAGILDPNAMWFAMLSVLVKEWLYRATLKIAREEKSSVLEANALHHRSDSLSSGVTFLAIGGSWLGMPILDPLGGLLVAVLIGKQGFELMLSALAELSDRGVDADVLEGFHAALDTIQSEQVDLQGWSDLRAIKSGVSTFVDVTLVMRGSLTLAEAREVEDKVRDALIEAHKGVKEVRIHLAPAP